MIEAIRSERFTHDGRDFLAECYTDDCSDAPWERADGHGPVRFISDREPLQRGEVILYDAPRGRWVYDWGAAVLQASREKWGIGADDREALARKLGRKPSASQVRAETIRKDMNFLRGWCADDWCYIGVCVRIIGPDGEPQGDAFDNALWGVESCGDYWEEVARDLAGQILADRAAAWRDALSEARKVRYWASRDVQTVGA